MLRSVQVVAALKAGAAAGVAYIATMEIDNRLTGKNVDDLLLLGRPLSANRDRARRFGALIHLGNAVGLGVLYAAAAHGRLPGPPWLRGALYATAENTALYPLAILEDYHPAIRDGSLDRYWSVAAYLQSVPRHLVYGAVLGTLYDRWRR